ncbi:MAG: phosphatase PAP2 family protein [Nocardioides sp.]
MVGVRDQAVAPVVHAFDSRADDLDRWIIESFADHRSAWATDVANATMFVGTTPTVLATVCAVMVVLVVVLRAYRMAVVVAVSLGLAMLSVELLKPVFGRPRPPSALAIASANGYSFPSTQAAETSAIAASLIVLLALGRGWGARLTEVLPRRAQVVIARVLVAAVAFVGVCMVYLGAHWPTDVVAGWVLGTTIGVTVGWVGSHVGRGGVEAGTDADRPGLRSDVRSS